ncbi:uncharacterized protein [Montipora foliosa]
MLCDCLAQLVGRYIAVTRLLIKWRWTVATMFILYSINTLHPLFERNVLESNERNLIKHGLPTESVTIAWRKRRQIETPNLLSPYVMESDSLSLRGWWMSHVRWDVAEMKQRSKRKPRQVFSVECTPHRMVETYQYLLLNKSIPVKGIKFQVSTASWKMSRPPSSRRMSFPFYGVRISVMLKSGRRKLLKMDFLPESGKLTKKKAEYICPRGERITSVTVMLGCFGYQGYLIFTDLALRPIYDSKHIENWGIIKTEDLLVQCQAPSRRPRPRSGDILTEILFSSSSPADFESITLVTQLTSNRIRMLKRILRVWNGPLSLVVYVFVEDYDNIDLKRKQIQLGLPPHIFTKFSTLSVIVIYGNEIGPQYPINRLRNIAIRNAKTQFTFLVDVDFVPSPNLDIIARNHILYYNGTINSKHDKISFVVPAFDGARQLFINDLPETKDDLVRMVKTKKTLSPFRQIESPLSHSSTNYSKWYHTSEPYDVTTYQDKYEPYVILRRTPHLPLYDERFTGYGMNKISHVIELALLR